MSGPSRAVLVAAIALSIAAISTAAPLVRYANAPSPIAMAFYRLLYATLMLLPFALWKSSAELRALRAREWAGLFLVGAVLALHFATWIASLGLTSIAASVFIVTLHPVFVAVASRRIFGEGVSWIGYVGIALALVGGVIITFGDATGGGVSPVLGDALAFAGALAAAIYFLAGRGYRRRMSLLAYVTPVYGAAALVLGLMLAFLPAQLGGGAAFGGYSWQQHLVFLAFAAVPMILGHTVLNWALKYVSAPVIATTILGEPVGATLLAFFFFSETPGSWTLLGGAVVLAGILIVALRGSGTAEAVADAPT